MASAASAAVVQKKPSSVYGANGTVRVTIVVGATTYLGGQFTAMVPNAGGTAVTRNHVAAVSTATGALLPWNPNVNGTVYTLAASGGNVYIGGTFTTANGATHKNLVEVDGANGVPVATFANTLKPNKAVRGLAVSPAGNLYVGGAFTTPRRFALEANATTGALIPAFAPVISNSLGTSPEVRADRRQSERHPRHPRRVLQPAEQRGARATRTRPTSVSARSMPPPERRSRGTGTRLTCRRSGPSSCSTSPRTARRCSVPAPATAGRACQLEHRDGRAQLHRGLQRQRRRSRRGGRRVLHGRALHRLLTAPSPATTSAP